MEADDLWRIALIEMTLYCISHVAAKILQGIGPGENGMTESASSKTTFGSVFHEEYQFIHIVRANRPRMLSLVSAIRRFLSRMIPCNKAR